MAMWRKFCFILLELKSLYIVLCNIPNYRALRTLAFGSTKLPLKVFLGIIYYFPVAAVLTDLKNKSSLFYTLTWRGFAVLSNDIQHTKVMTFNILKHMNTCIKLTAC